MEFIVALLIIQTLIIGFLIFAVIFVLNNPSNKDFRQHDVVRDQHTAMLVHELRSPLSIVRGSCDLLLKESDKLSREQIEELLRQIDEESEGLLNIVNDLLDVSKIESGKFEVLKEQNDINKLIKEESGYFSVLAEEKHINLSYTLDSSIKPFEFDQARIKQVLNNLLSNAIKFTDEGGGVIVSTQGDKHKVVVTVADTGVGVPRKLKKRLFQKYTQIHNNHSSEKGTGLGLVVAKGIVVAHKGEIWLEDNKPRGAKFMFSLPV